MSSPLASSSCSCTPGHVTGSRMRFPSLGNTWTWTSRWRSFMTSYGKEGKHYKLMINNVIKLIQLFSAFPPRNACVWLRSHFNKEKIVNIHILDVAFTRVVKGKARGFGPGDLLGSAGWIQQYYSTHVTHIQLIQSIFCNFFLLDLKDDFCLLPPLMVVFPHLSALSLL